MFRKAAAILLIPALLVFTTGCWGKIELNEIGIVTTTGVDVEPDGSMRITVLSIQPEGSPNAPLMRSITWFGSATGANLVDASKNLRRTAVKNLSWIHNSIVIVGQEAATSKMEEVVDFFSRNRELRFSSHFLVAGGKAFDMLQTPAELQRDLYMEMEGLIENLDNWSKSYSSNIKELLVSYAEHCGDLVTAKIWYAEEQRNTFSSPREDYEKLALKDRKIPLAYIEGCAVLRQGKFVGWLDPSEARGYLWIVGKIKPGAIISSEKNGNLAMENMFSSTSVKMNIDDDSYRAHIKVDVRGTLMEQTSDEDIIKPSVIQSVEDTFAEIIKSNMEKAVTKLQKDYDTDVLRFGSMINRQYPQLWKSIRKDWETTVFPKVKVEYEVKVTLERTGKVVRTIT